MKVLSLICIRILHSALERAWEEMYIAEGSDWFWWFGDDHSSAQDALFDYLFRKHLQNVYVLLGDTPPPELARPISRKGQRVHYTSRAPSSMSRSMAAIPFSSGSAPAATFARTSVVRWRWRRTARSRSCTSASTCRCC